MKFTHLAKFLVIAGLFALPALGYADWNALNMTEGATEVSKKVFDLHMLIFWDLRCDWYCRVWRNVLLHVRLHKKEESEPLIFS